MIFLISILVLTGALYLSSQIAFIHDLQYLNTVPEMMAVAIGINFIFFGGLHFSRRGMPIYKEMMPSFIKNPEPLIYISGVAEILGGIGLFIPATRWLAGMGLIALLLAILPANINAARKRYFYIAGSERFPWSLWTRIPLQFVYIALIFFSVRT